MSQIKLCPVSSSEQIWEVLAKGVLKEQYTVSWSGIRRIITDENQDKLLPFRTRYVLQATVHNIWRERNRRRHGETASPPVLLAKLINKTVRNKFSMIQKKDKKHEGGLQFWFGTRHD